MTTVKRDGARSRGAKGAAAGSDKGATEAKVAPPAAPEAPTPPETAAVEATVRAVDGEGLFTLEKTVDFVLRAIVQNQEALAIARKEEADKVRISVAVAPEDLGKVIGKQGRTINALRTVVKTAAARTETQVMVDLEGKPV